ncbi:permease prefix domain 1-containing protein [Paenibacillus sp. 1P07SE]|uniref:permease prefix domain 1-containing protein n=1 Tax=Paenibacillus sp. 1P07SE TaxID=3132209 RepID=UPI0039A4E8F9
MSNLKQHVDELFRGYRESDRVRELKEEILGNLEAKAADLEAQGIPADEARRQAAASLTSIDGLMDDHVRIAVKPFQLELAHWILFYLLTAWIFTIPARAVGAGMLAQSCLIVSIVGVGIWYLLLRRSVSHGGSDSWRTVRTVKVARVVRILWILWGVYIIVSWLNTSALHFGSNLWFGRPVRIDGPYQFASLLYRYMLPALSIVIPLTGTTALRLLHRHERSEQP